MSTKKNKITKLPSELPPIPPVPDGWDSWELLGWGYQSKKPSTGPWAYIFTPLIKCGWYDASGNLYGKGEYMSVSEMSFVIRAIKHPAPKPADCDAAKLDRVLTLAENLRPKMDALDRKTRKVLEDEGRKAIAEGAKEKKTKAIKAVTICASRAGEVFGGNDIVCLRVIDIDVAIDQAAKTRVAGFTDTVTHGKTAVIDILSNLGIITKRKGCKK